MFGKAADPNADSIVCAGNLDATRKAALRRAIVHFRVCGLPSVWATAVRGAGAQGASGIHSASPSTNVYVWAPCVVRTPSSLRRRPRVLVARVRVGVECTCER